jgi:hypothetical protein
MKLYAVIISWYFDEDIEDLCSKGEGHELLGVYTDLDSARERFHEERDTLSWPMQGWPVSLILSTGVIPDTDISSEDTFWKNRIDGYGYTKVSIETFEL